MTLAIPGTNGVESNFAEVALLLSLPFIKKLRFAFLLSFFTVFNAFPEPHHLPEVINHVISFPLVWLAYYRSKSIHKTHHFITFWVTVVWAYYFVGLVPILFACQYLIGTIEIHQILPQIWMVSGAIIYEYIVTTFIAAFYFLMIRELDIRKIAQQDLLKRNEEISRQRSLLQAQYNATQEGILVVSPKGGIVSWNQRFLEIWKIDGETLDPNGKNIPAMAFSNPPTDKTVRTDNSESSLPDAMNSQQDNLRLEDGRFIDRFTAPIYGENEEFLGRVWFFRDITPLRKAEVEREKLQRQFHQSQKMEAVGQLAGGVAHDFNNSLGAIIGAADLAMMENLSPEERQEYMSMIVTAARRASDLTRKLLTFSRKGTKEMEALDVATVLKDATGLMRRTIDKRIVLDIENRAEHTIVVGDDSLLQNALMNLGINASHAMPEGGRLSFTLENIELAQEYCQASPFELDAGTYLAISVRDTGTGMPPEVMSRIFEPFFTTKKEGEGTGLGLAAVYGSIQDHHGAITVYSDVGTGTIFQIFLPVSVDSLPARVSPDAHVERGTGTILVVDDEGPVRATTAAMLAKTGYKVESACNGQDGFEILLASPGRFDLVILDMIMPIMGGRQAAAKIKELDPSIPILLTSGFPKEDDLKALKHEGITGFLQKPFGRAALVEAVGKVLGSS
ncbi:MAG: hypothetical protein RL173_1975 [Fibrobacterota bacterium]